MIRRFILALALLAGAASPVAAQSGILFIPRYEFHLAAEHLSSDDPRFVWDTNFGGTIDLVDYGRGRASFAANYEAVLGEQFHAFDPNQGNYLLDLSSSVRAGGVEIAALLHHISRHLSDRPKSIPVDWNMFGVELRRELIRPGVAVRASGNLLGVLLTSNVDYKWEANGNVRVTVPLRSRISAVSGGSLRLVGVDGTRPRQRQTGARGEAGLRFEGQAGAIELIVSAERRIDAYPFDSAAMTWVAAGFRFVSR